MLKYGQVAVFWIEQYSNCTTGQYKFEYHASIEGRHISMCLRMDRYRFYGKSNRVTVPYEGEQKN